MDSIAMRSPLDAKMAENFMVELEENVVSPIIKDDNLEILCR